MTEQEDQADQLEWMTASEARALLGIGRAKMAKWLRDGTLEGKPSKFDGRVTLVRRGDVEQLLRTEPRPKSAPGLAE